MLAFFKQIKGKKMNQLGQETTTNVNEFIDEELESINEEVETELSVHPSWNLTEEQKYTLNFMHFELPKMKRNRINLVGMQITQNDSNLEVSIFIRNSSELDITLPKEAIIELKTKDNQLIAKRIFDLSEVGTLPKESSRPWVLEFPKQELLLTQFSTLDFKVDFSFEQIVREQLVFDARWNGLLTAEAKKDFQQLVSQLPPMKDDSIALVGYAIKKFDDGKIGASAFIRNSYSKPAAFKSLPVMILDKNKQIVAEGMFEDLNITIPPKSITPWSFAFGPTTIRQKDADLSQWYITIKNMK